jgi:hypothetical protein
MMTSEIVAGTVPARNAKSRKQVSGIQNADHNGITQVNKAKQL